MQYLPPSPPGTPHGIRLSSYTRFIIVELLRVDMSTQERAAAVVPSAVESPRAKLVYLYLDRAGGATADGLANALSLPKLSVYGVLGTLERRDLVERREGRYRPT